MYGRRDLVDAHTFLRRRVAAAVVRSDPDGIDLPLRRTSVGLSWGLVIAAVVAVVVVVLNLLLFRGDDSWRDSTGLLVVEQESGARYLVVDGALHPVANLTSAALLVGQPPAVKFLPAASMADVPRGEALGTAGLPDSLPAPGAEAPTWTACAGPDGVTVSIGPSDGSPAIAPTEGVLARAGAETFLVWGGTRSLVTAEWAARAIGLEPTTARDVDPGWLNTLPSAPDLGLPPVTVGGFGPEIAGQPTVLGQLVEVAGETANRPYVVAEDGLMPVTRVVAALLAAAPDSGLPAPLVIAEAQLAQHATVAAPVWQAQLPAEALTPMGADWSPCARWNAGVTEVTSVPSVASIVQAGEVASTSTDGLTARSVAVAPGAGRLVTTAPSPGVPGAGVYLLSEAGAKYPVADAEAATALGLSTESAQAVPGELLALLPTGPTIAR